MNYLNLAAQRYGSEYLEDIIFARNIALEIDADPLKIELYKNAPTIVRLCQDQNGKCLERTKIAERIAYGDANVFLACPNPSLAAGAIREMANSEHKKYFFDYIEQTRCTTFAAITEPQHGSDVASIETKLSKVDEHTYQINGEKCFITHGYDGKIAVVITRTTAGPLGIIGVILTAEDLARGEKDGSLQRELLPVIGMRGTCLSRLIFNNFTVSSWNILGQHLRSLHRGMLAIMKTFNLMRPCVAGFVLGQAQAIVDYITIYYQPNNNNLQTTIKKINTELNSARINLYASAKLIDINPLEPCYVSLAKAQLTNLTERIVATLIDALDASVFYEHPLLTKWFRDIYGFEYMEGTTNMQKRNIYRKDLKRLHNP
jgi:acyl-CoA dehydrogenase